MLVHTVQHLSFWHAKCQADQPAGWIDGQTQLITLTEIHTDRKLMRTKWWLDDSEHKGSKHKEVVSWSSEKSGGIANI